MTDMAQYTITHTCGHTTSTQLYGKGSERDSRRAYLASQPCAACKRAAANETAAVETAGLPALTGSDKQIAWATTIRRDQMALLTAEVERRLAGMAAKMAQLGDALTTEQRAGAAANQAKYGEMIAYAEAQTSASWWIDNRGGVSAIWNAALAGVK